MWDRVSWQSEFSIQVQLYKKNCDLKEKSHHDSCDCVVLIVIEVERATEARAIELDDWRAGKNLEGLS